MNKIELKEFFDYCLSNIQMCIQNIGRIDVKFSYNKNKLVMQTASKNSFSKDTYTCSIEEYEKIINRMMMLFSSEYGLYTKIQIINNKFIGITSDANVNFSYDIVSNEQLEFTKKLNNVKSENNKYHKNTEPNFEKLTNLFNIYRIFLRRCKSKNNKYQIYPYYNNGYLSLKITNNRTIVFYNKLECNEKQANSLIKRITEDFILNYDINNCAIKNITENTIEFKKLIEQNEINSIFIAKNKNFNLIVPFDINDPYYVSLQKKVNDRLNPKTLKLTQKISDR